MTYRLLLSIIAVLLLGYSQICGDSIIFPDDKVLLFVVPLHPFIHPLFLYQSLYCVFFFATYPLSLSIRRFLGGGGGGRKREERKGVAASPQSNISSPLTHKKGLILRLHPLVFLTYLPLFSSVIEFNFLYLNLFLCSRYHTGSLAFGSLIIAIVQLIRAGLEYLDHKLNGGNIALRLRKASYFSFESH